MKYLLFAFLIETASADILLDTNFKSGVPNTIKIIREYSPCSGCSLVWREVENNMSHLIKDKINVKIGDTIIVPYYFQGYYSKTNTLALYSAAGGPLYYKDIHVEYSLMESAVLRKQKAVTFVIPYLRGYLVNGRIK